MSSGVVAPPPGSPQRPASVADDDATQRSAGVPELPGNPEAEEDARPTIGRVREQPAPALAVGLPEPGSIVGGTYRVVNEIGRGSMGVVLSAFDQKLERTVAIKLIRAELLDLGLRRRFMDEARVMAQINHPNVVCIHAFGEHNAMPYFVMELVEGTTLEQWQRRSGERLDIGLSVKIMNDVCLGVSAIHEAGAVHRDIKPSNILLDAQLRSRVADFGVSALSLSTDGAEIVGTPGYIAPEVVLSPEKQKNPDPRSDVYALGCIAYELLTGAHPFKRRGEPLWTVVPPRDAAIAPPSSIRPDLPTVFDRVLLHAIEWDLERRTSSVEAFRRALVDAMESEGTPERIVVAEDDEEFRDLIELRLRQEFPGVDLECVGNGVAALAAVSRKPTSVALVDLQMPDMDGVALTAQLRDREDLSAMPIIVLTASGGAREWQRLSTLGADRFLVKPVQLDDVVTFIRQALRERGRRPPSTRAHSRGE
ncbi:MAG TPA: protein kinase [Polyangiaceae bacterium]|nr:protein kinase [Polyangiaceae bacterium]